MNVLFSVILLVSLTILTVFAPETALSSLVAGAGNGLQFSIKIFAVYAVWLTVLSLWEKMGFIRFFARKTSPFLKKIFPGEEENVYGELSVNLSTNFFGMGGAGTTAGINASKNMKNEKNRSLFLVINSTSIQLIPTTVIALRSTFQAQSDILLSTVISTSISTITGVLLVLFFVKR